MVADMTISDVTENLLEHNIIPDEVYILDANCHFDVMVEKTLK